MKVLLDVKDDKAAFVMELLQNFSFVKTKVLTSHKAKVLGDLADAILEMKVRLVSFMTQYYIARRGFSKEIPSN